MKKYLTETEKYEIWKEKFRNEMQRLLYDTFKAKVSDCFVSVYGVDKWNVYFNIRGNYSDINKLFKDSVLNEILVIKPLWGDILPENRYTRRGYCCKLCAKTEDEFNTKLGGLKLSMC